MAIFSCVSLKVPAPFPELMVFHRDYSQAMDVAGLSKLSRQQILNLVMALTFLAMGYATGGALFSAMHASGKIEAYLSAEFEFVAVPAYKILTAVQSK